MSLEWCWAGFPDQLRNTAPTGLLMNGKWIDATSGARFPVKDPASRNVVAQIADADANDAIGAIRAADEALTSWRRVAPRDRAELLRRVHDLMVQSREEIASLITLENGKSLIDSRAEVDYAAEFFRWYAEEAVRLTGEYTIAPSGANQIVVQHQPIGVSVLVTPWNFPAAMATRKIAPALAAGCTVVLKPAEQTPLTANMIGGLILEAGIPPGVVNIVSTSQPATVVSAMLRDPRVRKLSFTGSTEVGRDLLREAAGQVISCSMELGGNAPYIVFADADLDAAIEGLMVAKMRNGGQACTAANRIFIEEKIAEEFAAALARRMTRVRSGPGHLPSTELGPLTEVDGARKLSLLVDDAVGLGARVITQAATAGDADNFYPPTVLVDVPSQALMSRSEIFGPVAALRTFTDEDEVISAANDTIHGLSGYVYSTDLDRALRVASALECGMVGINRGLVSDAAAPFGGMKQSGLGREGGRHGVLEFTETQYLAVSVATNQKETRA